MLLSIITINLNNRNGLEQTIKSVLSQTWKDFEYIVIDGNSSDGSKDYLRSLPSNVSWISEVDTGIYNAMNKGIMRATGEYCLFLNSGDTLVDKEVLERAFSNHFTDDIVCFGTYDHSSNGIFKKYPPKRISLFTFTGGSLPHPSTFIKKKLFETIGLYQENYRIISDWCFFIQALIKHQASYASFDEILSNFICDGVSSTSSYKELQTAHDFLEKQFPRI